MGSGSSSNVKTIHIDQKDEVSSELSAKKNKTNSTQAKEALDAKESSRPLDSLRQDADREATIETLTKQLCESESNRLDLEDRVDTLLKELDYVTSQNLEREGADKPCDETLQAKDHYIKKMEKEKTDLESEVHKMKQKQRRKQKQFNTQIAEYKQEVNFQIMELKEEINRLKQENKHLAGTKVSQDDVTPKVSTVEDSPKLPGGEKMALILELSEQVTEQQDKINKLERKLKDKDQTIEDLRAKLKNNSQYLSVLNKTTEDKVKHERMKSAGQGGSDSSNIAGFTRNPGMRNMKNLNDINKNIDSLFTVDEESSENEEDSLLKLSSNLKDVKSSNKNIINVDSPKHTKSSYLNLGSASEPLDELEANNGRDSGLGSAGKREEGVEDKTNSDKKARNFNDWKDRTVHSFESGSGLSDSDFEQYSPGASKVSSAPPKLQNGQGTKLKKKSNSLRRHASSKRNDRPPRPGVAFVNSAESLQKDDHIINKLSPIISPVEVS